jgi:hypothetical protein
VLLSSLWFPPST